MSYVVCYYCTESGARVRATLLLRTKRSARRRLGAGETGIGRARPDKTCTPHEREREKGLGGGVQMTWSVRNSAYPHESRTYNGVIPLNKLAERDQWANNLYARITAVRTYARARAHNIIRMAQAAVRRFSRAPTDGLNYPMFDVYTNYRWIFTWLRGTTTVRTCPGKSRMIITRVGGPRGLLGKCKRNENQLPRRFVKKNIFFGDTVTQRKLFN